MEARSQLRHRPTRWVKRLLPLTYCPAVEQVRQRAGQLAPPRGIHFGEDLIVEKSAVRATLIVLLVVAAVIVLAGWFMWSYKTQHEVPTSPQSTSQFIVPQRAAVIRKA
jgi:F0F1-type ATP synthase membrane subunit a